ncbi:cytochrome b pre-mRNA-processing protein 3, partial [Phenoliferia sp. Uapishka_3]
MSAPRVLQNASRAIRTTRSSQITAIRSYATTPSSSATPPSSTTPTISRAVPTPIPTNLPGSNIPAPSKYSPTTVKLVTGLAKLFGYNSQTSTAIRTASDYYDRCAERGELEAPFFYEECQLPPSFQTWFSITTLHVWLLTVRFRSLPPPLGRTYTQELINHFFIDVELRIRGPYAVTQSRLIKGYMKDMLEQYRGSVTAYDEALVGGDAVMAAAIWRNVFGAGWGGVGGVKGKGHPVAGEKPALGPNPNPMAVDPIQAKALSKKLKAEEYFKTDQPVKDPTREGVVQTFYPEDPDIEFVETLERMVVFIRKEALRLERLSEDTVMHGRPPVGKGSLVDFSKI